MSLGIRGANPIWSEVDLQGNLFDDTFYMWVLENTLPYIPATVYHDPNLTLPWTNPIQFLANGTLPVDIFFEEDKVYRLEFRQNNGVNPPSQNDPLIYEVNDYDPGNGGGEPVSDVGLFTSNQITNPQFAIVNFDSPLVITGATNPDPIEVAPGWFLELTGTGNVTLNQVPLNDDNINPSNAPYALQLILSGWNLDGVILRQRFEQNGMLWASKIVSSTLTALIDGAPQAVNARLVDSDGNTLANVLSVPAVNGAWNEFTGHDELPDSINTDTPPDAYIEYQLQLPSNVDIYVTSIQLVVQDIEVEPSFQQDSIERQIDHTFHYYKEPIFEKPIPSYLVGWDFPLNPAQEHGYTVTNFSYGGANKSAYIWDQTIVFSSVNNVLSFSRNPTTYGLRTTTLGNTTFAIIQYIPAKLLYQLFSGRCAVKLRGRIASATIHGTVGLYWTTDATLPVMTVTGNECTGNSLVSGVTTGGANPPTTAVANGSWTQVARGANPSSAPFTFNSTFQDFDFTGFEDTDASTQATFAAIVISFNTLSTGSFVTVDYCSLVSGDIPTKPAPQTPDQVLRECRYYFEKSYADQTPPGSNTQAGLRSGFMDLEGSLADELYLQSFLVEYQTKRANPNLSFWDPDGTAAGFSVGVNRNNTYPAPTAGTNPTFVSISGNYVTLGKSVDRTTMRCSNTSTIVMKIPGATAGDEGLMRYQFTADSRFGVV